MPPLQLSAEQFDALAAQLFGVASEIVRSLDHRRTIPSTSGAETVAAFDLAAPEQGVGAAVVADFEAITAHARASTGRLFPYVVGSGEPVAALGDFLASILNQNVTAWR
jgi:aromatic-L-amino-acid/L-tryptophan decarboxylase